MKNRILAVVIFTLLVSIPASAGVKIVVNKSNAAASSMSKGKVADLFLKKSTRWENGQAVIPVDQADRNKARGEFSATILDKEVPWVKSYWQKMIFSGRATPPAELSSDAEVLNFVKTYPASIGYVSDGASIPAGVKVIKVD